MMCILNYALCFIGIVFRYYFRFVSTAKIRLFSDVDKKIILQAIKNVNRGNKTGNGTL